MTQPPFLIGHGYDIHRLQKGGRLMLGGVEVAKGMSAIAHSDGDVVIHALVDALLGALGSGDIGEHFPNSDPAYRGAASILFLQKAVELMIQRGYLVVNADVTIAAEQPILKPFKPAIVMLLKQHLGTAHVNVKAGTNEQCDDVGSGAAVAAHAVVLLQRAG